MSVTSGALVGNNNSQLNAVLDLLLSGEKLTHLTAHHLVGTISLQYHVWKLRQEGYPILSIIKQGPDGRKYAEYRMDMVALQNKISAGFLFE